MQAKDNDFTMYRTWLSSVKHLSQLIFMQMWANSCIVKSQHANKQSKEKKRRGTNEHHLDHVAHLPFSLSHS